MRNALLDERNGLNLLKSVYQRSTEVCMRRYFKNIFTEDSHLELYRRSRKNFDNRQMYAYKHIFEWRDRVAREEDDSTRWVLTSQLVTRGWVKLESWINRRNWNPWRPPFSELKGPLSAPGKFMTSGALGLGSAQPRQAIAWPIGAVVHRLRFSIYSGLYVKPLLWAYIPFFWAVRLAKNLFSKILMSFKFCRFVLNVFFLYLFPVLFFQITCCWT